MSDPLIVIEVFSAGPVVAPGVDEDAEPPLPDVCLSVRVQDVHAMAAATTTNDAMGRPMPSSKWGAQMLRPLVTIA